MKKNFRPLFLILLILFVLCAGAVLAQNLLENGAYWANDNKDISRDELRLIIMVPTNYLCVGVQTNIYPTLAHFDRGSERMYRDNIPFEDCSYSIENPKIVSVEDGVVTALSVGDTRIDFTYVTRGEELKYSIDFHVRDIETLSPSKTYIVDSPRADLNVGEVFQLKVYMAYGSRINPDSSICGLFKIDNSPIENIEWVSAGTDVVDVDENGFITGMGDGSCFVTALFVVNQVVTDGVCCLAVVRDPNKNFIVPEESNNEFIEPEIVAKESESEPGALSDNAESEIDKPNNLAETSEPKAYFAPYN